jgi:hypothetical protein
MIGQERADTTNTARIEYVISDHLTQFIYKKHNIYGNIGFRKMSYETPSGSRQWPKRRVVLDNDLKSCYEEVSPKHIGTSTFGELIQGKSNIIEWRPYEMFANHHSTSKD